MLVHPKPYPVASVVHGDGHPNLNNDDINKSVLLLDYRRGIIRQRSHKLWP